MQGYILRVAPDLVRLLGMQQEMWQRRFLSPHKTFLLMITVFITLIL